MQLTISDWGNSLALRIPKATAKKLGIKKGSKVNAELEDGKWVIVPEEEDILVTLEKLAGNLDLEEMVSRITDENRPDPSEYEDAPVGREIW